MFRYKLFWLILILIIYLSYQKNNLFLKTEVFAQTGGPTISTITVQTPGNIELYNKFEISFPIANSTHTNPYYPYDAISVPGLISESGITVDGYFLPPGESNWVNAHKTPCFYYQPVEEVGTGISISFLPKGQADWRCRFTPDITGIWQYRISATDKNGTTTSTISQFNTINSSKKGFIRVSTSDPRFFEFSDGTPFVSPLINSYPYSSPDLYGIRNGIPKLGQNGVRFLRWFPNREGGYITPYSDTIIPNWGFSGNLKSDDVDTSQGNKLSMNPYYYSQQILPGVAGATYKISFRAKTTEEKVLRVELVNYDSQNQTLTNGRVDVCSTSNTQHSPCSGIPINTCTSTACKKDGWQTYEFTAINSGNFKTIMVGLRGLYNNSDAPSPYDTVRNGIIRVNNIKLYRDETGSGGWGGNLLIRSDTDTYRYVDQLEAAKLDEILKLSEQNNIYHKLTIFHKNDEILNLFDANGNLTDYAQCSWGQCPDHFYSGDGQMVRWLEKAYMRYYIGRWSYSTALHSVEYVNEADLYDLSYQAGFMYAKYINDNSPRHLMASNSFWGYWADIFFKDPTYGKYLDFSDKHWYANHVSTDAEVISNIWQDTVANVRQCYLRFKEYATSGTGYQKPIIRGETGVAVSGTEPQDPDIALETTGIYYHKKVWAHTGILGYLCDGEWYPRLYDSGRAFPNTTYNTFKIYKSYDNFINGEPLNNGSHVEIGTDLTGNSLISTGNDNLRAFGSKDPVAARVLIWVDNKNNTWQNPNYNTSASGNITVSGMPSGNYAIETWNTREGTFTISQCPNCWNNGNLTFPIATAKDVAYKIYISGMVVPSATPGIPSPTPSTNPCSLKPAGDINCDQKINLLDLISIVTKYGTTDATNDVNGDGKVNMLDVSLVLRNFPGPTVTSTPTASPTAGVTVTPTIIPTGDITYGFDDIGGSSGTAISGVHSGIDFGSGKWVFDTSWAGMTNVAYFAASGTTSQTFILPTGRRLKSIRLSSSPTGGTYTVSDGVNPNKTGTLTANTPLTLTTNWTSNATTVTISITSGQDGVIDEITYGN